MPRRLWSSPLAAAAIVVSTLVADPALAAPCWRPPVDAPVVDPFREPACRWCPGNRGIEYGTRPGAPVRAVAAGTVDFAGVVAGTGYVVIRHGDGRRATYGGLADRRVSRGDVVVAGTVVGKAAGPVHFGLRDGEVYVDPAPLLGRLVGRPRLVPVDGRRANLAPPPRLRCSTSATGRSPEVRRPSGRIANFPR